MSDLQLRYTTDITVTFYTKGVDIQTMRLSKFSNTVYSCVLTCTEYYDQVIKEVSNSQDMTWSEVFQLSNPISKYP